MQFYQAFSFKSMVMYNHTVISHKRFKKLLDFSYSAYQLKNIDNHTYRQEGKVPYFTHPLWCSLIFLNDALIPIKLREIGYEALLLHDVLEDTSAKLPKWVSKKVMKLVSEMTFPSWKEEKKVLLSKPPFIKLLKLVDKLASMYDLDVKPKNKKDWKKVTTALLKDVEKEYGQIRVVQIGKGILKGTNW
jgi:(p)ppGpp synthase/HD superfamily hydrolase